MTQGMDEVRVRSNRYYAVDEVGSVSTAIVYSWAL